MMLVLLIIGAFSYLTHIACRLLDMDALCFRDHKLPNYNLSLVGGIC